MNPKTIPLNIISPVRDVPPTQAEWLDWLQQQAGLYGFKFALAHADDGVIWGRFEDGWQWSGNSFNQVSPPLRLITLQQLRLFGNQAELFLWRTHQGLTGRLLVEGSDKPYEYYDEARLLWGVSTGAEINGFKLMNEGKQGLHHTPPLEIAQASRLQTRHYLTYDNDGCVKIVASRLMFMETK